MGIFADSHRIYGTAPQGAHGSRNKRTENENTSPLSSSSDRAPREGLVAVCGWHWTRIYGKGDGAPRAI